MGLFLLIAAMVGAVSLRAFVPVLRPRFPAEPPGLPEPPPKAKEEIRAISFGGLPGTVGKLSPCPAGTRPLRVSKMFPDGTIRGAIVCVPDPKRAQGESSLRAPEIVVLGERQQLFGPIDLSGLKGAL